MQYFEIDDQLTLLAKWYTGQNTEDLTLLDKSIFSEFKTLYKAIADGARISNVLKLNSKTKEAIADELYNFGFEDVNDAGIGTTIISFNGESNSYILARSKALDATKTLLIDKLNTASDEERQGIYSQIDEISDVIAGKEKTPISKYSASNYLADFLEDTDALKTACVNTGFNNFNEAMDGGLYPGLYIMGAVSSMGKTSLMLQLADQIAAAGENVLYFTLEMGARELIAKSLSRYTYTANLGSGLSFQQIDSRSLTARSVLDKNKWANFNNYQLANFETAQDNYYSEIAKNLWYFESLGDIGTNDIRREVEKHYKATGRTPIIFIDYLQILKPFNEYWTEKRNTDKAITELRKLSRDYKAVIFCISSLNRGSYAGDIEMDAFKESGAIEYGSDVLLALQTPGLEAGSTTKEAKENKKLINEAKKKAVRTLELKILKNRSGETGQRIRFIYNAKFNLFSDDGSDD
jgi:replicative DNA helicase